MQEINLKGKRVLVTGAAGFIGANLVLRLLQDGEVSQIVGIDNLNDYYNPAIKNWRLEQICEAAKELQKRTGRSGVWSFIKGDISDADTVRSVFASCRPELVVNLAAQAGVRYSITNPDSYIQSNLVGFYNILEACRHSQDERKSREEANGHGQQEGSAAQSESSQCECSPQKGSEGEDSQCDGSRQAGLRDDGYQGVQHLIYASSSSVYGGNKKVPFSTKDQVDDPVSLYAATKKSNELMAHAYSKLYNIPSTGLRFFTVYGPAGRPDMAYFGFTDKLRAGKTIRIFNYGNCSRDFTYVDDIVEGIVRVMQKAPEKKNGEDGLPLAPYAVYNIGGGRPVSLLDFVTILQEELIRAEVLPEDYDFEAHKKLVPMQPGDVPVTYADTTDLERDYGYRPSVDLRTGLRKFAKWYRTFYMEKKTNL